MPCARVKGRSPPIAPDDTIALAGLVSLIFISVIALKEELLIFDEVSVNFL
jgi:hypothetical protein